MLKLAGMYHRGGEEEEEEEEGERERESKGRHRRKVGIPHFLRKEIMLSLFC
jgi:hypothetical protein